MTTIGEEIDACKRAYQLEDEKGKQTMRAIASLEYFKAEKIKEFVFSVNDGHW